MRTLFFLFIINLYQLAQAQPLFRQTYFLDCPATNQVIHIEKGMVSIFSSTDYKLQRSFSIGDSIIRNVAIDPLGEKLLTLRSNRIIYYNIKTGEKVDGFGIPLWEGDKSMVSYFQFAKSNYFEMYFNGPANEDSNILFWDFNKKNPQPSVLPSRLSFPENLLAVQSFISNKFEYSKNVAEKSGGSLPTIKKYLYKPQLEGVIHNPAKSEVYAFWSETDKQKFVKLVYSKKNVEIAKEINFDPKQLLINPINYYGDREARIIGEFLLIKGNVAGSLYYLKISTTLLTVVGKIPLPVGARKNSSISDDGKKIYCFSGGADNVLSDDGKDLGYKPLSVQVLDSSTKKIIASYQLEIK